MACDKYCYSNYVNKLDLDMVLAKNNLKFTYDPWYFFGEDFYFSKAEYNF